VHAEVTAEQMDVNPGSMKRVQVPLAALVLALAAGGCMFNNKIVPLAGEDPKALSVSGDRQGWLDRTGASRAFGELRKALRSRDTTTAYGLLGPDTRAALRAQGTRDRKDPEDLMGSGKAEGLGLAGTTDPLGALAADGEVAVREADPFDPARRAVRLRVKVGGRDEIVLPAVYTESGWRFELVRKDAAPSGATPAAPPGV